MTSFQKCKLSFNILAYLENYLQEPSADELLHHLFPPLAFLVDECYHLFGEDLVRDILSPLLTGAAVAMLDRLLGNKERVIWDALGDCWMKPRSAWDRDVVPYKPIFSDGWSPGVVILPDDVPDGGTYKDQPHQGINRRPGPYF